MVISQTFGVNPGDLSDEQWFGFYAKYRYLKEIETKTITRGILEAVKAVLDEYSNNTMDT